MKIIRLAISTDQLETKYNKLDDNYKELKAKVRDQKDEIKKLKDILHDLNIGQRRYWQSQTIFTSLQRKIERFEKVETEWRNYKKTLEDDMKALIEKRVRAQIGRIGYNG
ncbi:MAG: hypothetical protein WC375_11015 [Methanomassiliicoccales archaeon]|jgi:cell division protein FtsB